MPTPESRLPLPPKSQPLIPIRTFFYYYFILFLKFGAERFSLLCPNFPGKMVLQAQVLQNPSLLRPPPSQLTSTFFNLKTPPLSLVPRFGHSTLSLASLRFSGRRCRFLPGCIAAGAGGEISDEDGRHWGGNESFGDEDDGGVELEKEGMWNQMKEIAMFTGPAAGLWICGPLMSLIDTAVIGQGSSLELAALGNYASKFMFGLFYENNLICNFPLT